MDIFSYQISLHAIETNMKKQFGAPDERERPDLPADELERVTIGSRLRLRVSAALHGLARALDPAPTADQAASR